MIYAYLYIIHIFKLCSRAKSSPLSLSLSQSLSLSLFLPLSPPLPPLSPSLSLSLSLSFSLAGDVIGTVGECVDNDIASAATGMVKDQLQADKDASIGDRVGKPVQGGAKVAGAGIKQAH